ncbi:MAG: ATP-dependent helicase [Flavobacteriales bacterium]
MTKAFIGAAGTGKTHQLIQETLRCAQAHDWIEGQRILGLTFMHGSRGRMDERFGQLRGMGFRTSAETIDSFSLDLVRRFRRSIRLNGLVQVDPDAGNDWSGSTDLHLASFETIRRSAIEILGLASVQTTLRSTYPLIVVDEIQDCTDGLFEIVQLLSKCSHVICAGDEFQNLNRESSVSPVMKWLMHEHEVVELTVSKRTTVVPLLDAALRLRNGTRNGLTIPIVSVPSFALCAWEIASRVAYQGWRGSIALLSPVSLARSAFVRQTVERLEKEIGKTKKIGPYPVRWEETQDVRRLEALQQAWSPFEAIGQCTPAELRFQAMTHEALELRSLYGTIRRQLVLGGKSAITQAQFNRMASRTLQGNHRWRGLDNIPGRRGMSIHSAKNREFDRVVILWPYEASGDDLFRRRLLYNAVTRAKHDVVVIVQDGKGDRISKDSVLSLLA